MKLFKCNNCGQLLFFENTTCVKCNSPLGFIAEEVSLQQLIPQVNDTYIINDPNNKKLYKHCSNHQYGVCNWMVEVDSMKDFCRACELNRTIPDLSKPEYLIRWQDIETAKHRLVYSLLRMKLPLMSRRDDPVGGLTFDFVADIAYKIFTGHNNGLITINIAEADDIEREMTKLAMHETYRTLLGHFRHEAGHYYWDRLIANTKYLEGYRAIFGDERKDYNQAQSEYYLNGATLKWNEQYISAYASMHPWEDWAETWAHYMHIIDTLETAYTYGMTLQPMSGQPYNGLSASIKEDPYRISNFNNIMSMWLPLTLAMNGLNRSMGLKDAYPFIINKVVRNKLKFIHEVCGNYIQPSAIKNSATTVMQQR